MTYHRALNLIAKKEIINRAEVIEGVILCA